MNFIETHLNTEIIAKLEAAAFRSLRQHLQNRSDAVQNMELMAVSGFCRNCLAKWMVLEARRLVDSQEVQHAPTVQALNSLGYEEAAHHVYGMKVKSWKDRHQKKATDELMEKYNESKPIHATHDKSMLEIRGDAPSVTANTTSDVSTSATRLSSVCCQDVEEIAKKVSAPKPNDARSLPPYVPPEIPPLNPPCRIAVVTVSDRAYRGEYESGDLSGPAVHEAIKVTGSAVVLEPVTIVPDEVNAIEQAILKCTAEKIDLVITTGGTGMSHRDVTPEATRGVLELEFPSLMAFCITECAHPLASLSRGTAGMLGRTIVANLPGNPRGVGEIMPLLLPLLLQAVVDLRKA